jgi:hypothetical protein
MNFNYLDSILLQSVLQSEQKDEILNLRALIAYVDYLDHAIMTFEEFSASLQKLFSLGLITFSGKKVSTSNEFKNWFEKKLANKKVSISKELRLIEQFLKNNYGEIDTNFSTIEIPFLKEDFERATNEYLCK